VVAAQVGIILTALFTAALTNLMKYDQSEQSAMVIIEREITKSNLMNKAQEIISLWWRRCKGKSVSRRQQHQDIYRLHTELQHYKQASSVRSLALLPIVHGRLAKSEQQRIFTNLSPQRVFLNDPHEKQAS